MSHRIFGYIVFVDFKVKMWLFAKFSKNKHDSDDSSRWDVVPTKIKMDAILSTDIVVNDPQADKADKPKGD